MNPTAPGSGSSTDISLIPPLAFSVTSGFQYVLASLSPPSYRWLTRVIGMCIQLHERLRRRRGAVRQRELPDRVLQAG